MRKSGTPKGRPKRPAKLNTPVLSDCPDCPEWVNETGREKYNELYPEIRDTALPKDLPLFAHLCNAYGIAVEAAKELNAEGPVAIDKGTPRKTPHFQIWRDSLSMFNSLCSKFNLSPADRARNTHATTNEESDQIEDLISDYEED